MKGLDGGSWEETSKNKVKRKEAGGNVVEEAKENEKEKASSVVEDDVVPEVILEAGEVLERWFSWSGTRAAPRDWEGGSPPVDAA